MRFKPFIHRWSGIFLMLAGCVGSVWLGITGQLNLYIHPRYILFTVVMAGLGLGVCLYSFRRPSAAADRHDHDGSPGWRAFLGYAAVLAVCLFAFMALLVSKPATLTTATAQQRGINSSVAAADTTDDSIPTNAVPLFGESDYTNLSVRDWSSLLSQTQNEAYFKGKSVNITGFVTPDESDSQNIFFVSRFVVSCCAVDARPIGVPIYSPDWQQSYKADAWVRVEGAFMSNPSSRSQQAVVVQPVSVKPMEQPKDPYVY
ncbi:MAG TPA: TIGR03943 family protein [Candidatus Saccharimonadales bacterium]|jgi:uncharacterized repeat protein (TIGR03943 family)